MLHACLLVLPRSKDVDGTVKSSLIASSEYLRQLVPQRRAPLVGSLAREVPRKEPATDLFGFFEFVAFSVRHGLVQELAKLVSR